jgi:CheY-like chemotaxis protein
VLDGFEATEHIRQAGYEMPIVALTARVFTADAQRCKDAGMNDFLRKPFRQQELLAMIDKWLQVGRA